MIIKEIYNQIHFIKPKNWWKIETIKLQELFDNFKLNWISQIIRFNKKIFPILSNKIEKREISLFNRVNPNVNQRLIELFNSEKKENFNKWLIAKIEPQIISEQLIPVIDEVSLKIVEIIEMNNLCIEEIKNKKLFENWIKNFNDFENFKHWFVKEFENWRITIEEFNQFTQLFYRKIKKFNY